MLGVVVAPLAPSAAGIASITGLLIVLGVAFLATWALMKVYDNTLGAVLRGLAGLIDRIPFVSIGEDTIAALDRYILRQFGHALDSLEYAAGRLYGALAWLVRETGDALYDFASATTEAITGVVQGEIPAQIAAHLHPIAQAIATLRRVANLELARLSRAIVLRAQALEAELDRTFGLARRGIDQIERVSIPRLWKGITAGALGLAALRRYVHGRLERRLSGVEKLVLGTALTAAVLGVLTRYFPWWRCTNVRRFNRALCRMPVGFLNDLLALAGAVVLLSDVCRIGQAVTLLARAVEQPMLELVAVVDAATNCTSFPKPAEIPLRAVALPMSANLVAL